MESNNITDILDKSGCYCLNEKTHGMFLNIFDNHSTPLESEVDGQMILQLTFREQVTISQLEFSFGDECSKCPKTIKLYANKKNLDFSNVEDEKYTEQIKLNKISNSNVQIKINLTRITEWKSTNTLILFIDSNYGGDTTELKQLKIYGKKLECLNVNNITKGCCC
jgi:hypothetical protein